jgi:peptidoglycan hydrolase CwlO-like protein
MDDALNTIGSVQQEISGINEAAAENENEIDTITTSIGKIQNEINQTKKNVKNTLTKILTLDSIIDTFN